MEMWEEATKKPSDDDGGGFAPLPSVVENFIITLVKMVLALEPGQHVTREDVEREMGRTIDRPRWRKVDDHLNGHPVVAVERGAQNRVLYRRRT